MPDCDQFARVVGNCGKAVVGCLCTMLEDGAPMDNFVLARLYEEYSFTVDSRGRISLEGQQVDDGSLKSIYVNETRRPTPPLNSIGRDLVRVGTAILATDRLALRKPYGVRELAREVHWQRRIGLRIAVEQPSVWMAQNPRLEAALRLLTDDTWTLEYSESQGSPGDRQCSLFQEPLSPNTDVVLFSGGLDSTVGLYARHLASQRSHVAVSVYGNAKQRRVQENGLRGLKSLGVEIQSVSLCHQIRGNGAGEDTTQRARAIAYIFLAASVADACDLDRILSFEAGPGALNLPMHDAQVGSQNTRATHPAFLSRMQAILRDLLKKDRFGIEVPYLLKTKGEVCASIPRETLHEISSLSCSCDEGVERKPGIPHCGFCTSCLMRRSALFAALRHDDPSRYRPVPTDKRGYYDVQSYRLQALTLRRASHSFRDLLMLDRLLDDAAAYISDTGGCSRAAAEDQICKLLARYSQESLEWLDSAPDIYGRML